LLIVLYCDIASKNQHAFISLRLLDSAVKNSDYKITKKETNGEKNGQS